MDTFRKFATAIAETKIGRKGQQILDEVLRHLETLS
jgi:hypothetical protein